MLSLPKAWVAHLAAPFDTPVQVYCRPVDTARLDAASSYGALRACSALRAAGDAALSFGARSALTVPVSTYATGRWAWQKPRFAWAWLCLAPMCGVLGGCALMSMGLCCDALRGAAWLGVATGHSLYAVAQAISARCHSAYTRIRTLGLPAPLAPRERPQAGL